MKKLSLGVFRVVLAILVITLVVACGGPEAKKAKFFDKGKSLYEQGDYVKARLELKNAIQIDVNYAEAYHYLGLTELKAGNPRKAYGALSKAVELNPDLLDSQLELAKIFLAARAPDRALEKAEFVLSKEPANEMALLLKAAAWSRMDKVDEAEKILDTLLADGSTMPRVYLLLASVYNSRGEMARAEDILQKGIEANPQEVFLYAVLANVAVKQDKVSEAVDLLKKIIELEPEKAEHKLSLAALLWDLGQQEDAAAILGALVEAHPHDEDALKKVAQFYISKRDVAQAESFLKKAIADNPQSFQLRFLLSEIYVNLRNIEEATGLLEECLTLVDDPADPNILEAKNLLAKVSLLAGDVDRAATLTDEVLEENPKSVEAHFNKGNIYLLKGDGESAVAELRISVTERPQYIPGYVRLAQAHFMNNEVQLAGEALQKARQVNPDSREALEGLVRFYLVKKDFPAAEKEISDYLSDHEDDLQMRAALGDLYLLQKKGDEAKAHYEKIIEQAPENPLGYLRLSRMHALQGDRAKGLAVLEKGYAKNSDSLPLLSTLVQFYIAEKKFDRAVTLCEKRIGRDPSDAFTYNLLGRVYLAEKKFEAAEQAFARAIDLRPEWLAPHNNLASLYVLKGNPEEAIRKFEETLAANPDRLELYLSVALLYEQTQSYEKAIETYERALTREPKFWPALNNLAFLLSEYEDTPENLKKALELAETARKLRPGGAEILDTLGWIRLKMGEKASALAMIEEAQQKSPDNPVLNYHLGVVLAESDRKVEAIQHLENALSSGRPFPGEEVARKLLDSLRE